MMTNLNLEGTVMPAPETPTAPPDVTPREPIPFEPFEAPVPGHDQPFEPLGPDDPPPERCSRTGTVSLELAALPGNFRQS